MMTRKNVLMGLALMVVLAVAVQALPAWGQDEPDVDLPQKTKTEKALTKMGRGFSNILFGWAEVPVTFDKKLKEGKPLAYLCGVAPVLGAAKAVIRTGVGVYEAVSAPFVRKDASFEAVITPEYIF